MKNAVVIFYLCIALLICVTSIFILHHSTKIIVADNANQTNIDDFISNAVITEYDKKGNIKTIIKAEKIVHEQPHHITLFTKPNLVTYTEKNHSPWNTTADFGMVDKTGDTIVLTGNVIVIEAQTAHNPTTTIQTTELIVYPKKSRATTDQPVTITRPGTVIHGTGFVANLKTGVYQLKSESQAVYQPNSTKKH